MLAGPPLAIALLPPRHEAARDWPARRVAAAAVLAVLLLAGANGCLARGPEWRDDETLFEAAAATAAGARSAKVHLTRGALAARAGDGAAAAAAFHQALAIHPGSPPGLHTHRALVGGRVPAALRPADAVASHAGYEDALYSLGRLTMEAGDSVAAEPLLAEAVCARHAPAHPDGHVAFAFREAAA
jgi:Tfp pilus assembly protein PilF